MRGEIYNIYGSRFFTFGGARSVDKDRREEGVSWWKEEEPTDEEIAYGQKQLMSNINDIDYIITHETPLFAREHISRPKPIDNDYNLPAVFDEWYKKVSISSRLKKWYFGHMHADKIIEPKLRGVYNDILPLGEEKPIIWL